MKAECIVCGKEAARRVVFEAWHTIFQCEACGARFKYSLQGVFVKTDKGSQKPETETPA